MTPAPVFPVPLDKLEQGVLNGNRALLARAITLIESNRPAHQDLAQDLLMRVSPKRTDSLRIGITGVPGVGKSTFIEAFGNSLTAQGHKVAVLAVDPSSTRTGGSILGDKTRMASLAINPDAFIRPSPSAGRLGGVHRKTRETITLCEAAGYDIILVETVGAGQNETSVADMVDVFLILMLPGAGDDLQGIKKGILEHADIIAVNKADGENADSARRAAHQYKSALHVLQPAYQKGKESWDVPVITCSGLANQNLDQIWDALQSYKQFQQAQGLFAQKRQDQDVSWMWAMVEDHLIDRLHRNPDIQAKMPTLLADLASGKSTATLNAQQILSLFSLR